MREADVPNPGQNGAAVKPQPAPRKNRTAVFHLMLLPAVLLTLVFAYLPMAGLIMAFQDYKPWLGFAGSPWVGLDHFRYLLEREDGLQVIWNTLVISGFKIILHLLVPLLFALLLNEVRHKVFRRLVQTLVYMPHFLSWVIFGGLLLDLLSVNGLVNRLLAEGLGLGPLPFLSDGDLFRWTVILTDVWKEFGFGAIIFLAALAGVNPALYEAAEMDGAGRFRMTIHITLPAILPIVIVLLTLSLGSVLSANFDQIFNLYNALVYDKGDIIDTFVYRVGLIDGQFSFAAAVGMFKSVVSLILIASAYWAAYRFAGYRVF